MLFSRTYVTHSVPEMKNRFGKVNICLVLLSVSAFVLYLMEHTWHIPL